MPVPLGLVHLFEDMCHPYVALCKLMYLEDKLPTQDQKNSLRLLKMWLRKACHSAVLNGPSNLVMQWDSSMTYGGLAGNMGVAGWASTRHNMFLPPAPALPQAPMNSNQPLSAQEVLELMREERRSTSSGVLIKGCRVFTPAELELYVAVAGLPEGTSKEELVSRT